MSFSGIQVKGKAQVMSEYRNIRFWSYLLGSYVAIIAPTLDSMPCLQAPDRRDAKRALNPRREQSIAVSYLWIPI